MKVLVGSMMTSLLILSYGIRLFEQQVNSSYNDITSATWNILITMSTVGYGDMYAKSHCGRVIAIITAFWGIFFISLFVLTLIKVFEHDSSEMRAYNLMNKLK